MTKKTIALIILDGWGIGLPNPIVNPFTKAKTPTIDWIESYFPSSTLQASGIAVGLPWQEAGNSEVGHLTLGSGRIIFQNYPKITLAIRNKSFFKNKVIDKLFEKAKENNSYLHFLGLFGLGHVHSSYEHLLALIKFAEQKNFKKIFFHLFLDGRDSPPYSGKNLLLEFQKLLDETKIGKIASITGRFYAMDRAKNWQRTQKTWQTIVEGKGHLIKDPIKYLEKNYEKKITDEFIEPALIVKDEFELPTIKDNDAVFFFNFREDRIRQLFLPFCDKNFREFERKKVPKVFVATMIKYLKGFNEIPFAFKKEENLKNTLGEVISKYGLNQLKIAETEKYAHVTYFFNGQREFPFPGEERIILPSYPCFQFQEHPEMRAEEITQRIILALKEEIWNFILVNFANGDMIGHTGDYNACVKTIEIVDRCLNKILKIGLKKDVYFIITADHGNVEEVRSPKTGKAETKHDPSPVPIYLVHRNFYSKRKKFSHFSGEAPLSIGTLADIAPTVLSFFKIKKPKEMTGTDLSSVLI